MKFCSLSPRRAFTLMEIVVVLAILSFLSAIIFPSFSRARENARQTNCASNLQQIYFATQAYFRDERSYPDSLVDLLPSGSAFDGGTVGDDAPGYLKSGVSLLMCPSDSFQNVTATPRSSYGALSKGDLPLTTTPLTATTDLGKYAWNFWGYDARGVALISEAAAAGAAMANSDLLHADSGAFQWEGNQLDNTIKFSLSNRFAPSSTIVTHCVFHRVQTADNLTYPGQLSNAPASQGMSARDVILRLDGSVKAVDVSQWQAQDKWRDQTP